MSVPTESIYIRTLIDNNRRIFIHVTHFSKLRETMNTIFRLCVLAFIVIVEYVSRRTYARLECFFNRIMDELQTLAYDYRIHTPIGMFRLGKQIGEGSYGKVKRGKIV